jgi:hypothetical protein
MDTSRAYTRLPVKPGIDISEMVTPDIGKRLYRPRPMSESDVLALNLDAIAQEKRNRKAKELGVRADLTEGQLELLAQHKRYLEENVQGLPEEKKTALLSSAVSDLDRAKKEGDVFGQEKNRLTIKKIIPGPEAYLRAGVYGVEKGLLGGEFGTEPERAGEKMRAEASARMHPIVAGAGHVGEQIAEFAGAAKAVSLLKKPIISLAKKVIPISKSKLQQAAQVAAQKSMKRQIAEGAARGAESMAETGALMQLKNEAAQAVVGPEKAPEDQGIAEAGKRIGKAAVEMGIIGGGFGAAGGLLKGAAAYKAVKQAKEYFGASRDEIAEIASGTAAPARVGEIYGRLTTAGKRRLYADLPGEPGPGTIKGRAGTDVLVERGLRPKGVQLSGADFRILKETPPPPLSVEAGTIPTMLSSPNKVVRAFGRAMDFFSRVGPSAEVSGLARKIKGKKAALTRFGDVAVASRMEAAKVLDDALKDAPDYLRSHFYEAYNGVASAAELPRMMESLISTIKANPGADLDNVLGTWAKVAEKGMAARELETGAIKSLKGIAESEATAAGIKELAKDPEYFRKIEDWRRRAFGVFESPEYKPTSESIEEMVKWISGQPISKEGTRAIYGIGLGKLAPPYYAKMAGIRKASLNNPEIRKGYEDWLRKQLVSHVQDIKVRAFNPITGEPSATGLRRSSKELYETRDDLPQAYRDLLGEVKEPGLAFKLSMAKLNDMILRSYGINEAAKIPGFVIDPKQFDRMASLGDFPKGRIGVELKEGYGKLTGGLMTGVPGDKGLGRSMLDEILYGRGTGVINSAAIEKLDIINKNWKWIQTVANLWAHIRNPIGNIIISAMRNSIPFIGKNASEAMNTTLPAMKDYIAGKPMTNHRYWMEMLERGVIESEFAAIETAEAIGRSALYPTREKGMKAVVDDFLSKFSKDPYKNGADNYVLNNLSKDIDEQMRAAGIDINVNPMGVWDKFQGLPAVRVMNRIYNVEDQMFKMQDYARQRMAGVSADQAAAVIDRYYPNYSAVAPAVQYLRKFPIMGPFVTFKMEMLRVIANHAEDAAKALAAGDPTAAARFINVFGIPTNLQNSVADMSGIPRDLLRTYDDNAREYNRGAIYYRDPSSKRDIGVALGNYFPHSDWTSLYNSFNRVGRGEISVDQFQKNLFKNLYGLDDWYVFNLFNFFNKGATIHDEQQIFDPNTAPMVAWGQPARQLEQEEKDALGPIQLYLSGARLPETLALAAKTSLPVNTLDFFRKRYARELRLYSQGQRDIGDLVSGAFGVRVFRPDTPAETALREAGQFPAADPYWKTMGSDPFENLKEAARKSALLRRGLLREQGRRTELEEGASPPEEGNQ